MMAGWIFLWAMIQSQIFCSPTAAKADLKRSERSREWGTTPLALRDQAWAWMPATMIRMGGLIYLSLMLITSLSLSITTLRTRRSPMLRWRAGLDPQQDF